MKHVFPLLNFKALSPDQIAKIHVSKERSLLRVSVEFERRAECKNTSTRKRKGTKARDILKMYPEEKAKALMKRLHDRGISIQILMVTPRITGPVKISPILKTCSQQSYSCIKENVLWASPLIYKSWAVPLLLRRKFSTTSMLATKWSVRTSPVRVLLWRCLRPATRTLWVPDCWRWSAPVWGSARCRCCHRSWQKELGWVHHQFKGCRG